MTNFLWRNLKEECRIYHLYFVVAADSALYRRYANVCNRINGCVSLFPSCAGDEEWDDGNEQNVLEAAEQDNETTAIKRECYLLDCQLSLMDFSLVFTYNRWQCLHNVSCEKNIYKHFPRFI